MPGVSEPTLRKRNPPKKQLKLQRQLRWSNEIYDRGTSSANSGPGRLVLVLI